MIEPLLSIGSTIVVLAATKAVEKLGEEAGEGGWNLAARLVQTTKSKLGLLDEDTITELEAAEAGELDEAEQQELAAKIDKTLEVAPTIKADLEPLAEQAKADPILAPALNNPPFAVHIGDNISVTVTGKNNKVIGKADGDVNM